MTSIPWPPPYSVRVSSRARYARLRVLPGLGLEVVLPRGFPQDIAPDIIERNRTWIESTLTRMGAENVSPASLLAVPETVSLHGGDVVLRVVCSGEQPDAGETEEGGLIRLRARRDDVAPGIAALQRWFRGYAADVLAAEITAQAKTHGLTFGTLRFGRQKSRWGSCTVRGDINLNICLAFLPRELCSHIVLHELAHTRHCNHGQGFWKTLFAMEPDALALDKRLRRAWKYVPAWVWM